MLTDQLGRYLDLRGHLSCCELVSDLGSLRPGSFLFVLKASLEESLETSMYMSLWWTLTEDVR